MSIAEENHQRQHGESQQRAQCAATAGIPGLKIWIVKFGQGTPFPSGLVAQAAVGRQANARPSKWRDVFAVH
jgi:hypothetical protein